jgi:hypothetical protein
MEYLCHKWPRICSVCHNHTHHVLTHDVPPYFCCFWARVTIESTHSKVKINRRCSHRRNQFIGYMRDRVYHDEDLKYIFHKCYQKLDDTSGLTHDVPPYFCCFWERVTRRCHKWSRGRLPFQSTWVHLPSVFGFGFQKQKDKGSNDDLQYAV